MTAGPLYITSAQNSQKTPLPTVDCCMDTLLSDGSFIVACLRNPSLATGIFAKPFRSNGCLCWLNNFGRHQTCRSMYNKMSVRVTHTHELTPHSAFPRIETLSNRFSASLNNSFTIYVCVTRRGMDWILDSLTTSIHHSELHVITEPLLIATIHRSPQHPASLFPACCVFSSRSLTVAPNSVDSSGSVVTPLPAD
jgi:hypothetical protein